MHQINMRMSVALLRDIEAEKRAKEKAEAPTVLTEEQTKVEEKKEKLGTKPPPRRTFQNIWSRKFRPLPENKAVDLFADVIGDTFILSVAIALILYEYWRGNQKPDTNKERIDALNIRVDELQKREDELAKAEEKYRLRFDSLEQALRTLQDPKTKKPLLPTLQHQESVDEQATTSQPSAEPTVS